MDRMFHMSHVLLLISLTITTQMPPLDGYADQNESYIWVELVPI